MNSRRKPQRIPPPIDHGSELLDGESILEEFTGDAALLLWKVARSVRIWTKLSQEDRLKAFPPAAFGHRMDLVQSATIDSGVLDDLASAATILRNKPVDPAAIANSCRRIAVWAEQQSAFGTALEFMQAAAFANPDDASLARMVGLLARRGADFGRAETWFRQAIYTARRTRDRQILVRSYLGLGTVYLYRGNYPATRSLYLRALRAAKRYSLRELMGMAYHDLAFLAIRTNRAREVAHYARAALTAYGPSHSRLPALAHDLGGYWMSRGYFKEAAQIFEAIPPTFGEPVDRLARTASLARSFAAVGDRAGYMRAFREAERLMRHPAAAQMVATALANLGHGAKSVGDMDRAAELAERAQVLAKQRGESELLFETEALLESLRGARATEASDQEKEVSPPSQVNRLAKELTAAILEEAGSA